MFDVVRAFPRGLRLTLRGLGHSLRSRSVRAAYLRLVAGVFLIAACLEAGGLWAIFEFIDLSTEAGPTINVEVDVEDAGLLGTALQHVGHGATETGTWFLRLLAAVALTLIAPVASITLLNIVFPLFNDRVFMAALRELDETRHAELAQASGRPLWVNILLSLRRLAIFLVISVAIMMIGLIPVIGAFTALLLQSWFSARALAWELLDPYYERLDLDWQAQREHLKNHRGVLFGFSLPFTWMMAVPVIGPMGFGLAQASVAGLVLDIEGRRALPPTKEP